MTKDSGYIVVGFLSVTRDSGYIVTGYPPVTRDSGYLVVGFHSVTRDSGTDSIVLVSNWVLTSCQHTGSPQY